MRLTRIIAAVLTMGLVIGAFAGVALAQKKPVVIDVYGVQWLPGHLEEMAKLVDNWNKNREDVKINWIRGQWSALRPMLITGTAAGTVPDIVNVNEWSAREFGARGAFTRLNDMLSKGYLEKLHPIVRVTGTDIKGDFWMLANEWEVNGMTYYNAKILRDAGVRVPEWDKIWSWDEAREILKKVADPSKGRAGLTFRYPRNDKVLEFWLPLVWQEGAEIVKYENNKPKMDLGEPAVRAMTFFHDLVKNDKTIPSGVMGTTTDSELAAFLDGKTAFVREGPWFADLILRAGRKDLDWGVMHPWKGKRTVAPIEATGWSMSSTVKDKEAALEVMWYLTASKGMVAYNKKGRMLPTTLENLADPAFQTKDDWFHVQQLAIKSGRPYPNHPMVYAFGNNVVPEITHMMIEDKISPRDTIRALEREGTYMMREFE